MSHGWSDTDKQIAQRIAHRAKSAAEEEALRLFRGFVVKTADDLWALELKIRDWRRDRWQVFTLNYANAEEQIAGWISRGWIKQADIETMSPGRRERVRARVGYGA